MLNDASGFKKVYLATGFTDLRRGIDGLAAIVRFQFQLDPYDKNTLFLFCEEYPGSDTIKIFKDFRYQQKHNSYLSFQRHSLPISILIYDNIGLFIVNRTKIEQLSKWHCQCLLYLGLAVAPATGYNTKK